MLIYSSILAENPAKIETSKEVPNTIIGLYLLTITSTTWKKNNVSKNHNAKTGLNGSNCKLSLLPVKK